MLEENKYICSMYKQLLENPIQNHTFEFENDNGRGKVRKKQSNNGIIISNWSMKFNSDLNGSGLDNDSYINFCFCKENEVLWEIPYENKKLQIEKDQFYIYRSKGEKEQIYYKKDIDFEFTGIKIPKRYFQRIIEENFDESENNLIESLINNFSKSETTPIIKKILLDLDNLSYQGGIASIFIEGKIMELMAICFKMFVSKKHSKASKGIVGKTNIESIKEAKRIIDSSIPKSISCEELAKCVHTSKSILCKGFKGLYGMPVHSYIIDQKLEIAERMLQQGIYNVSEVASFIGYSNMSHFSAAFRKKYGTNPKKFQNNYITNLG